MTQRVLGLLKPQPAGDQGPEEGVEALRAGAEAAVTTE